MRRTMVLASGLVRDPTLILVGLVLAIGLAMIAVVSRWIAWRDRWRASNPAFEHLIGRAVAVGPGADIGDHLFAGGGARLDCR